TRTLDRWPDGSCRWVLLDWLSDVDGAARYRARVSPRSREQPASQLRATVRDGVVAVNTGRAEFYLWPGCAFPGAVASVGDPAAGAAPRRVLGAGRPRFGVP